MAAMAEVIAGCSVAIFRYHDFPHCDFQPMRECLQHVTPTLASPMGRHYYQETFSRFQATFDDSRVFSKSD
jgi:hypothetical protein